MNIRQIIFTLAVGMVICAAYSIILGVYHFKTGRRAYGVSFARENLFYIVPTIGIHRCKNCTQITFHIAVYVLCFWSHVVRDNNG
jgi:hypothetical protein